MHRIGFDNDKYLKLQSQNIRDRISKFGGKLYLEFGGKLFDDYHASRVLPGFAPDSKVKMLLEMKDEAEIVIAISADDIERSKRRGDLGITYDDDTLRLIDAFRGIGLYIGSVVLTHYRGQAIADKFQHRLEALGVKVYRHYIIPDYPSNIPLIVSDDGFGRNDYIETTRSLVVVTAPGPGSGKMATCLSQLYHEHKRGVSAGYAKFETFPVWNLPLKHPVNLAYEAATADLDDVNMIDPFHLEAYGTTTVNYNRDVEIFPVLEAMFKKIYGDSPYKSPTDMGVNMNGFCIFDDDACCEASKQEIIRRYYKAVCDYKTGNGTEETVKRIRLLMNENKIEESERAVVRPALEKAEASNCASVAIELEDGRFVTGKSNKLMTACASAVINAVKTLSDIPDEMLLLSPIVLAPIISLKKEVLREDKVKLSLGDVLSALSICAATNPVAEQAMNRLVQLRDCDAHASCILPETDLGVMRKLGVNLTCEPEFGSKDLYGF